MTETASKSSSEYTGLHGLSHVDQKSFTQKCQNHTQRIHVWYIYKYIPTPKFTMKNQQMEVDIPYMDPIECYALCIEYVSDIYHRFKLNSNRYSIGGASLQKSRSSYVEQNHSPHQRTVSNIWNGFPSFLIQGQTLHHLHPEKLTWNLKITNKW